MISDFVFNVLDRTLYSMIIINILCVHSSNSMISDFVFNVLDRTLYSMIIINILWCLFLLKYFVGCNHNIIE
jgi:hypothetical protein